MTFPISLTETKKIIKAFGVMGTPTHIIIDRKGVIRYSSAELADDL
ncbi:MAG TPA: hypothetical protein DD713_00995 [Nitrospiraceae bacterium]|nr:hypothetical protein [Nitrospiraceae bacterium]